MNTMKIMAPDDLEVGKLFVVHENAPIIRPTPIMDIGDNGYKQSVADVVIEDNSHKGSIFMILKVELPMILAIKISGFHQMKDYRVNLNDCHYFDRVAIDIRKTKMATISEEFVALLTYTTVDVVKDMIKAVREEVEKYYVSKKNKSDADDFFSEE